MTISSQFNITVGFWQGWKTSQWLKDWRGLGRLGGKEPAGIENPQKPPRNDAKTEQIPWNPIANPAWVS